MSRTRAYPFFILAVAVSVTGVFGIGFSGTGPIVKIEIARLDPRFDQLVPRDAKLEKIADGFTWQAARTLFFKEAEGRLRKWLNSRRLLPLEPA